jgi:hypothetical protein
MDNSSNMQPNAHRSITTPVGNCVRILRVAMEKRAHLLLKLIVCVSELASTPTRTKNAKNTKKRVKAMGMACVKALTTSDL